jgi:anti-sigma factor ChrR (cupin superfamily)
VSGLARVFTDLLLQAGEPERLSWETLRPGVAFHALYGQPGKGPSAALLRYEPGATVPEHRHTDYEHVLILAGSQRDANGLYAAGTLLVSPPGSRHAVVSDAGCLVLAIWAGPIEFAANSQSSPVSL